MKRVVTFKHGDQKNQKRFELLYGALLIGGNQREQRERGGIEVLRREARLLDALDGISGPNTDPAAPKLTNDGPARLVQIEATVVVEQPDFDLLKKRLEETPWLPNVARDVVDAVDWLSASPEQKES